MAPSVKQQDKKEEGRQSKNPDVLRLELAKEPNKPENIDYYTRLDFQHIYTIAHWRSIQRLAKISLEKIKALENAGHLSEIEKAFLTKRRAILASKGVDVEEPFMGIKTLCDNFEILMVSKDGKGRTEWYSTLEPKAPVTANNIAPWTAPEEKKKGGIFGIGGH